MLFSCTLFSFQRSAIKIAFSLTPAVPWSSFFSFFTSILQWQRQEHFGDLRRNPIQDSSGQTVWGPSIHYKHAPGVSLMMLPSLLLWWHFCYPPIDLKPHRSQIYNDLVGSTYMEHFQCPQPWDSVWPVGGNLFYFILNFYLFGWKSEYKQEGREPGTGLDPRTPRSWPELKADA